jgi:tetratricopeptide (TPR) repeat protein
MSPCGTERLMTRFGSFKKNVAEFPESSNVYDSLGEAFAAAGKKDLAIENYEKSIKLDPKNQNGIDRLKKLKDQE